MDRSTAEVRIVFDFTAKCNGTSQQTYGAAVYIRCGYVNDSETSRLIAAKNKVAPLNPMTVPRLELLGAILGLRLT